MKKILMIKIVAILSVSSLIAVDVPESRAAGAQDSYNKPYYININQSTNQSGEFSNMGSVNQSFANQSSKNQTAFPPKMRRIDASTWNHYGIMLYDRGYFNYSTRCFNESINQSPSFADPRNNIGVALVALQNYSGALQCFDEALKIFASDRARAVAWNNKGVALYRMGNLNEARDCFNKALDLDLDYSPAWSNLGAAMAANRSHQQALQYYNRSLALDAFNARAWNNKAVSLAKLGCYESSLECLKNAVILNRNYTLAWVNAATVLRTIGEASKSQKALSTAKEQGYNRTDIHLTVDVQAAMMKDNITDTPLSTPSLAQADEGFLTAFSLLSLWAILDCRRRKIPCY